MAVRQQVLGQNLSNKIYYFIGNYYVWVEYNESDHSVYMRFYLPHSLKI
jgi:hypothetical protein